MSSTFELPITHLGKELLLSAELIPKGYAYQIKVIIDEVAIFFEPDEEKNYRALASVIDMKKMEAINKELLQAISESLHILFD